MISNVKALKHLESSRKWTSVLICVSFISHLPSLFCTRLSFVCTRLSLVCTRLSFVCTRLSLVCTRLHSSRHASVVLVITRKQSVKIKFKLTTRATLKHTVKKIIQIELFRRYLETVTKIISITIQSQHVTELRFAYQSVKCLSYRGETRNKMYIEMNKVEIWTLN